MRSVILLFMSLLLLTGCSQTVKVHVLQPAEVDRAAKTTTIAVHRFRDDSVGLSSKIEAELAGKRIDGKNYFTMISRRDIERIFEEQRLQNSGLLDESSAVEVGNLLGAQALISGIISTADSSDSHYRERRTKCADKKCKELYEYTVPCVERTVTLAAQVKMVDIEKGDIIYSDALKGSRRWHRCSDQSSTLPSASRGLEILSNTLASRFAHQLTPHYRTFSVVLLEDPDMDYSDLQEAMLENALVYIEHQRYEKAERLLSRLLDETSERSYVAAYNLGVVKEIQGERQQARQLYTLADDITIEPVEEIDAAMVRIVQSISEEKHAREQMLR